MSVSYWQDTVGLTTEQETDIVIVGAGLAGLSTAYWLSKLDPDLRIQVVDKDKIGSGASGRNAGFITCGSTEHFSRMSSSYGENKAAEIWKFTEYNHRLMVEEFGKEFLEENCEYRNLGSWTLAATEHEIEVIGQTVGLLQKTGVNVEWCDQVFEGTEGFYGGAFYKDDGEIHPAKYLWHLALHTGNNVNISENTEVFDIDTLEDKIIVTEPVDAFLQPAYCSFVLDYFRQLVDGRVLIGGFRNADAEKEVGYSDEINPRIHKKLEGFLNEHFPILRGKRIDYRWSGVMGFAADGYPMVGSLTEDPRIYYNVGFTAHGLGFTFATGELVAKLVLEGQDPGIFSGRRFQ